VVDNVLASIETYFPGLSIERGSQLNFLGMEIDFFEKGKLKLGTVQYLKNMIEELEELLEAYGESQQPNGYSRQSQMQNLSTRPKAIFTVVLWRNYYGSRKGLDQTLNPRFLF
jgi:hypothetical protein